MCLLTPETSTTCLIRFLVIINNIRIRTILAVTSLRAAGIFFCFLEKAKVALFPGVIAPVGELSSDKQEHSTCSDLIQLKFREYKESFV